MSRHWIWEPPAGWVEATNVHRFMKKLGIGSVDGFLQYSRDHLEEFWDAMVRETGIEWFEPYRQVLDTSEGIEWTRWFLGGKTNIAWNCLDRYRMSDRIACIGETEDGAVRRISFRELYRNVSRLANALRALGLERGDRVALTMPMVPEVVTILYACHKLGLVVVPIFAGFGAGAIATRLQDSGARVLFTADRLERRSKLIELKEKTDAALASCPTVSHAVVLRYRGGDVAWKEPRDIWWEDFVAGQAEECESLRLDGDAPAFILYTSGTTGKPKGTVHTHAGSLAQMTKEIYLAFDHRDGDIFFWVSDIGWMMGPWTIVGNHNFGGTIFLYDGAPDFPSPDRLWQMVERHGITTLGISPTAIRMLMRHGSEIPERYPMKSLRLLGSTGEPWDETSYLWFFENAGKRRLPIINISGGTEIAGSFLFVLPVQPLKACTLGGPAPGMGTDVVDGTGRSVRGSTGYLVCRTPAPSMTRGIWGDPQRYIESYWSRWKGMWYHGDWARVDEDGHWFVHGRADESMNVSGRKVGPAEVEQALMQHASVAEAAVIGVPDEMTGEAIVAFVVPRPDASAASEELCRHVADVLGPAFRPRSVQVVSQLPKTQSGKVVRRLIRQYYLGEAPGDLSTVENADALKQFGDQSPSRQS
ncbi:MAG: AMP-binding protein [Bryobacteraceae bacterium]|nr:AMP-binding protein [Bryobacterales bacterium]MEB2362305.1 AMP-binding protein [Bryobacterales bacterium]NUN03665.1 AMP-binding protein [Bryobacteraceae bacterium]